MLRCEGKRSENKSLCGFATSSCSMHKDGAWFVLVLILCASLLLVLVSPISQDEDNPIGSDDRYSCPQGTLMVENLSNGQGFDCVYPDPHALQHAHPAPILSITEVVDDGSVITVSGFVDHLHPSEILVSWNSQSRVIEGEATVDEVGEWWASIETVEEGKLSFQFLAMHTVDQTVSTIIDINVSRYIENVTQGGEENNTEDTTGNSGENSTSSGSNHTSTGNQTENSTGEDGNSTSTNQPTYAAEDMAPFWLDVFRCQSGQTVNVVDDLTTSAVESHQCSVTISYNDTHITILANGLPDHDFESTLACSQAGDCAAAQGYEWVIPRAPRNDTTGGYADTNCPEANGAYQCAPIRGEVAIAINGVPFYGPEDGPGGDAVASHHGIYQEDRQPIELGVCHAHSGQGGTYHYHADANCLHWHPEEGESIVDYDISSPSVVANNTENGSHSAVIGVAFDGFPIYGFWGYDDQMNVVEMKSSYKLKDGETGYNGIDDYVYVQGLGHLDMCNGHFGPTPEFPEGIYHYHSTMMNGEGDMGFPYFLICYHGEASIEQGGAGGEGPDCSGFGETWGPGIGPPPAGCENGGGGPPPNGQHSEVAQVESRVFSPLLAIWLLIGSLLFSRSRRE